MKETSPLYRNLTLAAFAFTAALDVGGFFAVSALVDHFKTSIAGAEELGWFVDAVAGVAKLSLDTTVLLVAPILGLSLVQILLPMLGESLFMEALAKESRVYADRLEACSGLPAQDAVLASLGRAALLLRYELFVVPLTTVVGILPVVGPILGSTLQLSVTSFTIGWELLDVWCEKQGLSFTEQQKLVEDKRFTVIGFGLPFSMMLAVPLIGPLSIGIAQSAAATFVVKEFPKLQAGPARRQEGE